MLKQTAVYWPLGSEESGGVDVDEYGRPNYGTAYEIKCRWEDKSIEFLDANGTSKFSQSIVYLKTDVRVGGVLFLGTLLTVTDLLVPKAKENVGSGEIQRFDSLPSLSAKEFLRTAYL